MANPKYNDLVPEQLALIEMFREEDELVNFYTHIAELNAFLAMMRAQSPLDKAWKDLQVVLDVFADFVIYARNK